MSQAEFDRFAGSYDEDLAKSLAITGDDRMFYARGRVDWTLRCMSTLNGAAKRILDYGCGDGANAPILASAFQTQQVWGVDVSSVSIAAARQAHPEFYFSDLCGWNPDGSLDLIFTNGVFHHIPPVERHTCLIAIRKALRPGGWFAFWENNPWNPGTRYVMSQCAFDEQAVTISPREARKLLSEAGYNAVRTDSLFYFPHQLRLLRPAERWLRGIPLGGQYQVLCRNPAS